MNGFSSFSDIVANKKTVKPPAYPWQDLALQIIKELSVPGFKRGAMFKVCKEKAPEVVRRALNDTKELCQTGEKWKYFFKIIDRPYEKNVKWQNPANYNQSKPNFKKSFSRSSTRRTDFE